MYRIVIFMILFLKGMSGALAPFSYLVEYITLAKCNTIGPNTRSKMLSLMGSE
jgi:hypothetical protein